jgi:hypothetical protein
MKVSLVLICLIEQRFRRARARKEFCSIPRRCVVFLAELHRNFTDSSPARRFVKAIG